MNTKKICMSGIRGHNGYVLDGIRKRPDLSIAAITGDGDDASTLADQLEALGSNPQVYENCEEMLAAEQPDVLTIAGPFARNARLCVAAFEQGIHVFCEKPVASTGAGLAKVVEAYEKSDVHFGAMMGLRYDPAFYTAWNIVQSGQIGEVRLINAQKSYKLGERPEYYKSRDTYGGTIPWVGSHAIDWIHWFGGGKFRSVTAHHSTRHNRGNGELEVTGLCHFLLSDEIVASATIDYFRPENASTHGDDRVRVVGTEGVVEASGGEVKLITANNDGTTTVAADCPFQIFTDFIDEVEGKSTSLISAEDIIAVTDACLKARQSADSETTVEFA